MKATLTVGNSQLCTDLTDSQLHEVMEIFYGSVMNRKPQITETAGIDAPAELPARSTPQHTRSTDDSNRTLTGLYEFRCEACGCQSVVRMPRSTTPGDIACCPNCKEDTLIMFIDNAFGRCKCGRDFHHMGMINGLREHICKSCGNPVDLAPAKNGMLESIGG